MTEETKPRLMTIKQASEYLKITSKTYYQYIKKRKLRPIRHNGRWMITEEELKRFLEEKIC